MNSNQYHQKFEEYILFAQQYMYIFEVVRPGICSTLVFMYKEETIIDLFNKIFFHYGCKSIRQLYYYSTLGEMKRIDTYPNISIRDFIRIAAQDHNAPVEIVHSNPNVYRVFFEE